MNIYIYSSPLGFSLPPPFYISNFLFHLSLSLSLSKVNKEPNTTQKATGMGGADEEWVKAAMTDDTMVVELLVRLHGAAPPLPPPPPSLPLVWTVRQRRSRSVSATTKKLAQSHRASPCTPLSWSGGTSLSGGSGGAAAAVSEESDRPHSQKLSTAARSKLNGDSDKAISKRSRKKKTLAELKNEENSLLKERRDLKREISALRVNLEKQIAENENLKRIKIELQPLVADRETASATEELQLKTTTGDPIPSIAPLIIPGNAFVLPDLNMPFDDPCPDVICGVS